MPNHVNPREKIQQYGIEKLDITELIAVILGHGTAKSGVQTISEHVVNALRHQQLSLESLRGIHGIGLAKACQLLAMVEFMERVRPVGYPVVDELQKVLDLVSELRSSQREHIVCLYLNTRLQLLLKETLAIGSVNQSAIAPRDVFAVIKHHPVSFLIFVHNHPSGNPTPSAEDLRFTQHMMHAAAILGIEVLDHVIVGGSEHYSLRQHHQMELSPDLARPPDSEYS